ncbi:MAG: N-acetylmuramoyl-L-alanine amidase [Capsulimonas sp.]|uniref:N-acetylmuramoyl-L-alanine amidase family protein n=1 Tax=Capsulimonas sp. TaxID=2494211 RepID=UPI0032635309
MSGYVVCVDPGHTSETSAGTQSRDGKLTERHLNWVVAVRLKKLLEDEGATVVMTKSSENEFVTNMRRAEIANDAHAALFLRLHCDSGAGRGFATYYPARQGTAHGVTGPPQAVLKASAAAAKVFHKATIKALDGALPDHGLRTEAGTKIGGKQGALTGSIFSKVPALTVEMVVLNNAKDYAFARTEAGQEKIAEAILAGVEADAAPRN